MTPHRAHLHSTPWTGEEISRFAEVKRFLERFQGDAAFRERLPKDPAACAREHGFRLDPDELRCLWDVDLKLALLRGERPGFELPPLAAGYRAWINERLRWRDKVREACAPRDPRWRTWRERQMNRACNEMGDAWSRTIIFDTAAIELSKGCSVGCWFCGVAAPRLQDHLRATLENRRLFRGVMEVLVDLVGVEAASAHFLYWASDPLDNPDYEQFCEDFRDVVGVFPLMTSALALRDVERTRRVLRRLLEDDSGVHRFSVLTLRQLDRIHQEFTPEELARVELVLLNPESIVVKANSGRFRQKAEANPAVIEREVAKMPIDRELLDEWEGYAGPGSIACVTGVLINLVERTIKLITPCKANDRWPLGYVVFDEGRFGDPADLRRRVEAMIEAHMPACLPAAGTVRFRDDLSLELTDDGFSVFTPYGGARFGGNGRSAYFKDLGALIAEGTHSGSAIADRLLERHAVFHGDTFRNLDWLFGRGLLREEPELVAAATAA